MPLLVGIDETNNTEGHRGQAGHGVGWNRRKLALEPSLEGTETN